LYSINESKKQSKDNDERNVFFKMIDILQNNSKEVVVLTEENKVISQGSLAFDYYRNLVNKFLFLALITNFIYKLDDQKYKTFLAKFEEKTDKNKYPLHSELISAIVAISNTEPYDPFNISQIEPKNVNIEIVKTQLKDKKGYENIYSISNDNYFRHRLNDLYLDLGFEIDDITLYNSIHTAATYLFAMNGTKIDNYCNSFRTIIESIKNFEGNKEKYYALLVSSLSRDQLAILLIFSFSRFSSKSFVENLLNYNIFQRLDFMDLIIFVDPVYISKDNIKSTIIGLHKYYLKNHIFFFNS